MFDSAPILYLDWVLFEIVDGITGVFMLLLFRISASAAVLCLIG